MYAQLNKFLLENVYAADGRPIGESLNIPLLTENSMTTLVLDAAVKSGRAKHEVIVEIAFTLGHFLDNIANPAPAHFQ